MFGGTVTAPVSRRVTTNVETFERVQLMNWLRNLVRAQPTLAQLRAMKGAFEEAATL
jgi:hypothetical protein